MSDPIPEIPGTVPCPVCQKRILLHGTPFPEEYEDYRDADEDDEDRPEDIDDDCPVQRGWSMPIPFQVGELGFLVATLREEIYPPLTLVCQSHLLKKVITEEILTFLPPIKLINSEYFCLSTGETQWIQERIQEVEGSGSEQEKIVWVWIQMRNYQIAQQESDRKESGIEVET